MLTIVCAAPRILAPTGNVDAEAAVAAEGGEEEDDKRVAEDGRECETISSV